MNNSSQLELYKLKTFLMREFSLFKLLMETFSLSKFFLNLFDDDSCNFSTFSIVLGFRFENYCKIWLMHI